MVDIITLNPTGSSKVHFCFENYCLPQNFSNAISPSMPRLSLLIEYIFRVFACNLTIRDVNFSKQHSIVLIFDLANRHQVTLQYYEMTFFTN